MEYPTGPRSANPRSGTDVAHDVLDPCIVLEAVNRQVFAVPGVLEPAVGHLRDERNVSVDPDGAEVQRSRGPHRPSVIACPYARGQTVLDAVGPPDRLVLRTETLDGDDRAEDLLLDH